MLRRRLSLSVIVALMYGTLWQASALAAEGQTAPAPATAQAPAPAPTAAPAPASTEPVLRKKPVSPPEPGTGCGWIGRHAVLAIVREDVVASNDYMTLFERFGCERAQVRSALDCTLAETLPEQAGELVSRVDTCWPGKSAPGIR